MTEERKIGAEIGNVVWFDQKKGFGFIKVITPGSEYLDKEIFVHFTSIQSVSNFKKLYPGENVSLDIVKNDAEDNNGKEFLSQNITGLYGTPLLVDNDNYIIKIIRKRNNSSEQQVQTDEPDQ
ncbi:MAG: hypothetical protein CMG46_00520 [Candidatus Marinimicrobia bacterium]|nr:hypothetical protein [Candidatus Neomarinimicrobiota bacterium]